jgi:hypothetical protein
MVSVPLPEKERLVQDDAADPVPAPGHHNRTLNDQIMPASTQPVGKMTTGASVDENLTSARLEPNPASRER